MEWKWYVGVAGARSPIVGSERWREKLPGGVLSDDVVDSRCDRFSPGRQIHTASYKEFGHSPWCDSIQIFTSQNGNALIFQFLLWKWIEKYIPHAESS